MGRPLKKKKFLTRKQRFRRPLSSVVGGGKALMARPLKKKKRITALLNGG